MLTERVNRSNITSLQNSPQAKPMFTNGGCFSPNTAITDRNDGSHFSEITQMKQTAQKLFSENQ